jgi:regulator of replication initiation timing
MRYGANDVEQFDLIVIRGDRYSVYKDAEGRLFIRGVLDKVYPSDLYDSSIGKFAGITSVYRKTMPGESNQTTRIDPEELQNRLANANDEIVALQERIFKLESEVTAKQSVIRTRSVEIANWQERWSKILNENASMQLERAKLKSVLAKRENRTGRRQMPLNAEAAQRYFDELDAEAEVLDGDDV